ncbi:MAG: leucine-rich repeat domain-containing protein [Huintestinicola sp.]|uniref:protein kinase domain-containing protein n=1 Tax=Huintestinicola sp. TaxID=2981661 RepID=UPI003F0B1FC5
MNGKTCKKCGYTETRTFSERDALPVGTKLNGRYIIGKMLGRGGFGITYLAYDENQSKAVAIKEYYPAAAVRSEDNVRVEPMTSYQTEEFSEGLERFFREADIIRSFKESAEIMGLYDVFRMNGTAYYAMEFFNGISLNRYVSDGKKLTEGQAVNILEQLLPALSAIHNGGILHRDVSPDNIMLCTNGRAALIDFGSARILEDSERQNMSVILKDGFAPLEQYQRQSNQGSWTDIYSLGMSLYYSITGRSPENPIIRLDDDSTFIKETDKLSEGMKNILRKACGVRKEDRYLQADEMLEDIKSCHITPEEIELTIDDTPQPNVKKSGRKKKVLIAVIAAVSSAAAFFIPDAPTEVKIGGEMFSLDSTELYLQNRELTNSQISNLRHMKKLKSLDLSNNFITDMSCLDGLTELECICFDNNNISDISFMRSMTHLKHISGNNNSISDISVLSGLTELENVFLGDNYITDISPLKNSRGLVYVGFDEAKIGDIRALSGMTSLKMAGFSGCGLESIEPLRDCKSLELVYFGRNRLTDVSPLAGCNIKELYLDNNLLSGHTDTFSGITLNGFACIEGNGFTEEEIQDITNRMNGEFTIYY